MSTRTQTASPGLRWAVIAAIAGVAFFASYRYAVAAGSSSTTSSIISTGAAGGSTVVANGSGGCCGGGGGASAGGASGNGVSASGSTGGGCCGGGAKGPATTKSATVSGSVQKISVDVSKGYYDPSTIQLKAGVPAEITFSQASGCTGIVQSQQLNFYEDLSAGPKTVKIAALQPGTYSFTCGMGMVYGSIVVK